MSKVGQSTIYGSILPNFSMLWRIAYNSKLSKEAKHRLKVLDFYYGKGGQNASLTARHFGHARGFVIKWRNRFNPKYLPSLESHSCRPKHIREAVYDYKLVSLVKQYREDKDTCFMSAKKLASIFWTEYEDDCYHVSPATIGRIIKRFNYFFHPHVTLKTRSTLVKKQLGSALKKRKPAGLVATGPRQLIEFDMKHFSANGMKYYCMCAIDQYTKEAVVHCSKTGTSMQAKIATQKALGVFGKQVSVLNDNGSENLGEMWKYLEEEQVAQYFAHPHAPKEKGCVERFIGSLDRECLVIHQKDIHSLEDLEHFVIKWLNNYHLERPHMSLKNKNIKYHYYTPAEYCATMGITITLRKVYTR